jgi:hypothetical protein
LNHIQYDVKCCHLKFIEQKGGVGFPISLNLTLAMLLSQNVESKEKLTMPVKVGSNTDDLNGYPKRVKTERHSVV